MTCSEHLLPYFLHAAQRPPYKAANLVYPWRWDQMGEKWGSKPTASMPPSQPLSPADPPPTCDYLSECSQIWQSKIGANLQNVKNNENHCFKPQFGTVCYRAKTNWKCSFEVQSNVRVHTQQKHLCSTLHRLPQCTQWKLFSLNPASLL